MDPIAVKLLAQHLLVQSHQWNNRLAGRICSKLTLKTTERRQGPILDFHF